jgi:hypothetical protein
LQGTPPPPPQIYFLSSFWPISSSKFQVHKSLNAGSLMEGRHLSFPIA